MKKYGYREPPPMTRTFLNNQSVTCNDGSPAGYYIRRSEGSSRWIVFLEGGWLCYDKESCEKRWQHSRKLMTSAFWEPTKIEDGILSPYPEGNPYWWNANHVYIPYCSSDCWSGSAKATRTKRFAFMGALIIQQTIKDLLDLGLRNASLLLLAGSSAGGTGAMLNVDRVRDALTSIGVTKPQVRALTDSGWFLDNAPFRPVSCKPPHICTAVQSVQLGVDYWEGLLPDRCVVQYPAEKWRCYFGFRIYPTLRAPLFVFQWIFDQAQMQANNVGHPRTQDQWDYIYKSGDALRHTFQNVSAVFAPACVSHMILTSKDWVKVSIQGITLPKALKCWAHQPHEHNHHEHHADHDRFDQRPAMDKLAALLPPNYQNVDYNNNNGHQLHSGSGFGSSPQSGNRRFPMGSRTTGDAQKTKPEVRDMLADAPIVRKRITATSSSLAAATSAVDANRVDADTRNGNAVSRKNDDDNKAKSFCEELRRERRQRRRRRRRHGHGETAEATLVAGGAIVSDGDGNGNRGPPPSSSAVTRLQRERQRRRERRRRQRRRQRRRERERRLREKFNKKERRNVFAETREERRQRRRRERRQKCKKEQQDKKNKRKAKNQAEKEKEAGGLPKRQAEKLKNSPPSDGVATGLPPGDLIAVGQRKRKEKNKNKRKKKKNESNRDENEANKVKDNEQHVIFQGIELSDFASLSSAARARAERSLEDANVSHRWMLHDDICQHRLIDTCNWPMCNQACPPMTNPITGKSMELIDLLQSFGTDMGNVASALDIDIETLRTMDKQILSKMLTQSS